MDRLADGRTEPTALPSVLTWSVNILEWLLLLLQYLGYSYTATDAGVASVAAVNTLPASRRLRANARVCRPPRPSTRARYMYSTLMQDVRWMCRDQRDEPVSVHTYDLHRGER